MLSPQGSQWLTLSLLSNPGAAVTFPDPHSQPLPNHTGTLAYTSTDTRSLFLEPFFILFMTPIASRHSDSFICALSIPSVF